MWEGLSLLQALRLHRFPHQGTERNLFRCLYVEGYWNSRVFVILIAGQLLVYLTVVVKGYPLFLSEVVSRAFQEHSDPHLRPQLKSEKL